MKVERYPGELDFISLFECLPTKKDDEAPFEYNESTFAFEQSNKRFIIKISPFYNQFSISVWDKDDEIMYYDLQTVTSIEILSDKKDDSRIRLFLEDRDRFSTVINVTFKPKFKVIVKDRLD